MSTVEDAELHRMQKTFRRVLDACARPGTVQVIAIEPGSSPCSTALDGGLRALVRLFVDQATTFAVVDAQAEAIAHAIISETHARCAVVHDVDFVVVSTRTGMEACIEAIQHARCGTLVAPERGATVFLGCTQLADVSSIDAAASAIPPKTAAKLHEIEVRGPGVKDVNRFFVDRTDWAFARQARRDEFPCGIEIMLVDQSGNLVVIPRSSELSFESLSWSVPVGPVEECHLRHDGDVPAEAFVSDTTCDALVRQGEC